MKKRILALLISTVMAACLCAGCGGNSSSDDESNKTSKEGSDTAGATIGYNIFGSGPYALGMLANNTESVIKVYGHESMALDDEFSVEKIIQDVENMISSGCDGLVIWLPAESLYPTVAKMCADAQIPFALNDKIPTDPDIIETLKANEYFVGCSAPDDNASGKGCAEYAIDKGWKTCIITSSAAGDSSDTPRIEGFREAFEEAGGEIREELHADNLDESVGQVQDALTATGEVDFIYGTSSDYGLNACTALAGKGFKTKVISAGLETEALDALTNEDSPLVYLSGDCWVSGIYSAVLVENAIAGTTIKDADGKAPWIDSIQPFQILPEEYDLYKTCFIDNLCYSDEELLAMNGMDYDSFMKVVNNYSFEDRVKAKLDEGLITQDDIDAAGLQIK